MVRSISSLWRWAGCWALVAATLVDIVDRLAAAGITSRIAVAASYGAAHALARYAAQPMVSVADEDDGVLADLPVAALRLPAAMVDALRRLGFDRIGELAATPRAPLALRLGSDISRRLDQMFGRSSEPFDLVEPLELISVRQAFAEPIAAAETIARYTAKLVELVCAKLEDRGLGARKLDLLFYRVDPDLARLLKPFRSDELAASLAGLQIIAKSGRET